MNERRLLLLVLPFFLLQVTAAGAERERIVNSIGMEMVNIEPGSFIMGFCSEPLPEKLLDEKGIFPNGDFDEIRNSGVWAAIRLKITRRSYS
jgi:hypothetical protein